MFAKGQQYKILVDDAWIEVPTGVVVNIERCSYDDERGWKGRFMYDGRKYFMTADDVNDGLAVAVKDSYLTNTVIILNAPPGSGKDTIAAAISEATGAVHSEFKAHLYQCAATLFNVPVGDLRELATNRTTKESPDTHFEVRYDQFVALMAAIGGPRPRLSGNVYLTPRQSLIYTSECVFKPVMGDDYFGKIASNNIDMQRGAVFSDGGFDSEVLPIIEQHGAKNVFVVQFTGQGVTGFEGDSRNFLNVPKGIATLKTTNDGTVEEIRDQILDWIKYERDIQATTFGG